MSTMNYYVVLGIAQDADADTIRSAFRALARRFHPDAGAGSSTDEFRRAVEAYETLGDPHRRRVYDRALRGPQVRPTIIAEPLRSRAITSLGIFDEALDELFGAIADELELAWAWRAR